MIVKTFDSRAPQFYWQNGYGLLSANPADINIVGKYIENRDAHHWKQSFQTEHKEVFRKSGVELDEQDL